MQTCYENYHLHHKMGVGSEKGAAPPPQDNKNEMNLSLKHNLVRKLHLSNKLFKLHSPNATNYFDTHKILLRFATVNLGGL